MEKIKQFDNVHIPKINKTGFVRSIKKDKLMVCTTMGNIEVNKKDVELLKID